MVAADLARGFVPHYARIEMYTRCPPSLDSFADPGSSPEAFEEWRQCYAVGFAHKNYPFVRKGSPTGDTDIWLHLYDGALMGDTGQLHVVVEEKTSKTPSTLNKSKKQANKNAYHFSKMFPKDVVRAFIMFGGVGIEHPETVEDRFARDSVMNPVSRIRTY